MFAARCSLFAARCSLLAVRCWLFAALLVSLAHAQLPNPALVGYWHNWSAANAPYIDIDNVDSKYNVIAVAFALPTNNTDMTMVFTPDRGTVAQLKARIQNVQSKGGRVLLSIGGSTATIDLTTAANRDAFSTSLLNILDTYGFDGLDVNIEHGASILVNGGTIAAPQAAAQINLIDALKTIMKEYRTKNARKMLLTFAPETAYIQGGMSGYGNIWGGYLPIVDALRDSLDLIHVQLYNSGTMYGIDGQIYTQGTADFIVSQTEAVIRGFASRGGGNFGGIPASKVAVGLPACTDAAGGGYVDSATVSKAVNYLMGKGARPGQYTLAQSGGYTDLRGMMTWSINWDATQVNRTKYAYATLYSTLFSETKTTVPNKVVLVSPSDGYQLRANQAQFVWMRSAPEVVSYQLEARNNGTLVFNDSTLTDTTKSVNNLPPSSTLTWRVRAKNVTGWGEWSEVRIIKTLPYPTQVTLINPANGEQLKSNAVVMRWKQATPEVERYRLQLYNAQGAILADTVVADTALPFTLLPASSYSWRVMAQNASGWGEWSAMWTFRSVPYPQSFALLAPSDAAVLGKDSLELKWTKSGPDITAYQVEVMRNTDTLVVQSLIVDTTLVVRMLKPLAWHTWRVRAQNASGWGSWSATWKFRYLPVPTQVEQTLPVEAARIHVDSVRLAWLAATSEVTAYQIEVYQDTNVVYSDTTITSRAKNITGLTADLLYLWRVRARNQSGWGPWSTMRTFMLYKSSQTTVHDNIETTSLFIFPQPASSNLSISGIDLNATSIRLYDLAGSLLMEKVVVPGTTSATIDVSSLSKGAYILVSGRSRSYVIVK